MGKSIRGKQVESHVRYEIEKSGDSDSSCPPPPTEKFPEIDLDRLIYSPCQYKTEKFNGNFPVRHDSVVQKNTMLIRQAFEIMIWNRNTGKRRRHRNAIAIQFYGYVLLLRCFFSWTDSTQESIKELSIAKPILQRVIWKWKEATEDMLAVETGVVKLNVMFQQWKLFMLKSALYTWHSKIAPIKILKQVFYSWKTAAEDSTVNYQNLLHQIHHQRLQLKMCNIIHEWKIYSSSSQIKRQLNRRAMRQVFEKLKMFTHRMTNARLEMDRALTSIVVKNWNIFLVTKVFQAMKKYVERKQFLYSASLEIIQNNYRQILLRAFKHWKQFYLRLFVLRRVFKRSVFLFWNRSTKKQIQQRKINLQILVNRWRIFTEDRIEWRLKQDISLRHWAQKTCKKYIGKWEWVVMIERQRKSRLFTTSQTNYHCFNSGKLGNQFDGKGQILYGITNNGFHSTLRDIKKLTTDSNLHPHYAKKNTENSRSVTLGENSSPILHGNRDRKYSGRNYFATKLLKSRRNNTIKRPLDDLIENIAVGGVAKHKLQGENLVVRIPTWISDKLSSREK